MPIKHLHGNCLEVLRDVPAASVQLIVTSPPYADARASTYGGTPPDEYVAWFLPIAVELKRVLKPTGTFILNIKEKVVDGERHTYVMELVLALRKQGWLWTEEWIWYKKNCVPGHWPNRFRDTWEHLYQFNLERKFDMHQKAVMVPMGDWAKTRIPRLSEKDRTRDPSASGSGFAKNVSNWAGRDKVYPTNVLDVELDEFAVMDPGTTVQLATETGFQGHSAAFPVGLPEFFIKLFTREGETVLDPFQGSGTSGVAATNLRRDYVGIDWLEENIALAKARIERECRPQGPSLMDLVESIENSG